MGEPPNPATPLQPKTNEPKATDQKIATNNGWFGGIFSKLSLKPKNQMKLPDDKNPTVKLQFPVLILFIFWHKI